MKSSRGLFLAIGFVLLSMSVTRAACVAPTAPANGNVGVYQQAVQTFVLGGCFLTAWTADAASHLTGSTVSGVTYSVHDQIKVYYSPAMLSWMQTNRPDGITMPSQIAAIPDGAAMVAAIMPVSGSPTTAVTGYLVMIRQAANRKSDPASGWFFSQIIIDPNNFGGTRVAASMGNYSLGLCVACHSSAVNNLTFASFANTKRPPT